MNDLRTGKTPRLFWGLKSLDDEQIQKWILIYEHNLDTSPSEDPDYYHTIITAISELKTENSKRFEQQYGQKANLFSRTI